MKRIKTFHTDEPARLASELHRFEDTTANEIDRLPARFIPQLSWSEWMSGTPAAAYDVVTRLDSSTAAVKCTLPSLSPDTRSRIVGVLGRGGSSITLVPVEATALIDGSSTYGVASDDLVLLVHDGENWYRI